MFKNSIILIISLLAFHFANAQTFEQESCSSTDVSIRLDTLNCSNGISSGLFEAIQCDCFAEIIINGTSYTPSVPTVCWGAAGGSACGSQFVSWDDPVCGMAAISGYTITRSGNAFPYTWTVCGATSITFNGNGCPQNSTVFSNQADCSDGNENTVVGMPTLVNGYSQCALDQLQEIFASKIDTITLDICGIGGNSTVNIPTVECSSNCVVKATYEVIDNATDLTLINNAGNVEFAESSGNNVAGAAVFIDAIEACINSGSTATVTINNQIINLTSIVDAQANIFASPDPFSQEKVNTASICCNAEVQEAVLVKQCEAFEFELKERTCTPQVYSFFNISNSVAVSVPVPPGTNGKLISIEDVGAGQIRFTIDGSNPGSATGPNYIVSGPYHANYNLDNIDLSQIRIEGTSNLQSDVSLMYCIYE